MLNNKPLELAKQCGILNQAENLMHQSLLKVDH